MHHQMDLNISQSLCYNIRCFVLSNFWSNQALLRAHLKIACFMRVFIAAL